MPSIKEKLEKSKGLVLRLQNTRIFVVITLILMAALILGFFRLASIFKSQKTNGVVVSDSSFETNLSGKEGAFVGAKTGKKYYFPWCGTVNRIKDENLVWFQNRASAEAKGYEPSSNCHGLK